MTSGLIERRNMNLQSSLIDDLEDILASKDISRRAEILRRVTDLFVVGSGNFSEEIGRAHV